MRFLVSVQTPDSSQLRAAGDWIVDAENGEMALAVVMDRANPHWWPLGSTWTVRSRSDIERAERVNC